MRSTNKLPSLGLKGHGRYLVVSRAPAQIEVPLSFAPDATTTAASYRQTAHMLFRVLQALKNHYDYLTRGFLLRDCCVLPLVEEPHAP